MVSIFRIVHLSLICLGAFSLVGITYWTWLFWPLPQLNVDWQEIHEHALGAGECQLAFDTLADGARDDAEGALEAAEAFVADPPCKNWDAASGVESVQFEREMAQYESFAPAPSGWLDRLGSVTYAMAPQDEMNQAEIDYPVWFWPAYLSYQVRCYGAQYDGSFLWWRLERVAETFKDQSYLDRAWVAREEECARWALRLARPAGQVALLQDDEDKRTASAGFAQTLFWEASSQREESELVVNYEMALLELQLGASMSANACSRALPNSRPSALGNAADTFAGNLLNDGHVPSGERLVELYSSGEFLPANEEAAAFWQLAIDQTPGRTTTQTTDEAEVVLDQEAQARIEHALALTEADDYQLVLGYLPPTVVLEDSACYEWGTPVITRAVDKPKPDGLIDEDGADQSLDAAEPQEEIDTDTDEPAP